MVRYTCCIVGNVLVCATLMGCTRYQRSPLELDAHLSSWSARVSEITPVYDYHAALNNEAPSANTSELNLDDGCTLQEAEALALVFNANLRRARAAAHVPLMRAEQSGWWPDPQVQLEILRFVERGQQDDFKLAGPSINGINPGILFPGGLTAGGLESAPVGVRRQADEFIDEPWIVGASVNLTVPLSGRLALEKQLAWAQYDIAWQQIVIAEWRLLNELHLQWLQWSTTSEQVRVVVEYTKQLDAIRASAEKLAQAGELRNTDYQLIEIAYQKQLLKQQRLANAAELQRLQLLQLLGVTPTAPLELIPQLTSEPAEYDPEQVEMHLVNNHPEVRLASSNYESAERSLRLEVRRQYPDLNVGPSYSWDEGLSRLGLGFGFAVPLWNRNRQAIAEAQAEREAARVRAEATAEAVMHDLRQWQLRLRMAESQQTAMSTAIAPLVDHQLQSIVQLLSFGEVNMLLVRDALSSALSTKLALLDLRLEYQ